MTNFRSGYIAIIGKPNVGKSTLINRILGQKLCITSRRPQTTRHRILGIKTDDKSQCIYVDTPGLHSQGENAMNRYMNRAASASIIDVDVVLFVVDGLSWQQEDEKVLQKIKTQARCPVMLLLNKVDKLDDKKRLLPYLKKVATYYDFAAIMPISARQGIQIKELEQALLAYLPVGELIYPEDQITDRSMRFLAAEMVREKFFRQLGQELPYSLTVEIEQYEEEASLLRIGAVIYVERQGQKAIVIGKKGGLLKTVGREARIELEKIVEKKVFLTLWVKVRDGWSDNDRILKSLGYHDDVNE
ncbi:MAG TPA: GTPase Era [Gammaproteobacteria bacterium]|nr:GTPase Era [Gammaproteobacteria bacterium]